MDESKDTVKQEDAASAENANANSPSVHFSSLDLKLDGNLSSLDPGKVTDTAQASVFPTTERIRDRAFSMGSVVSYRNASESTSLLTDLPLLKDTTTNPGSDSQSSAVSLSDDEDLLIMAALVSGENGQIDIDLIHPDSLEITEHIPDDVFDAMLLEHARQESLRTSASRPETKESTETKEDASSSSTSCEPNSRSRSLSLSLETAIVTIGLRDRAESLGFGLTELMMLEKSGCLPEVLGISDLTAAASLDSRRRPLLPTITAPSTAYLSDDSDDSDSSGDGIGDGELATPLPAKRPTDSSTAGTAGGPPTLPPAPGSNMTPRRLMPAGTGPTTRTAAREAMSVGLPLLSEPPSDIFAGTPYGQSSDTLGSGVGGSSAGGSSAASGNAGGSLPKLKIKIKASGQGGRGSGTPKDGSLSHAHTPGGSGAGAAGVSSSSALWTNGVYSHAGDSSATAGSPGPTHSSDRMYLGAYADAAYDGSDPSSAGAYGAGSASSRRTPSGSRRPGTGAPTALGGDGKDSGVSRRITRSQPLLDPFEPLDSPMDSPGGSGVGGFGAYGYGGSAGKGIGGGDGSASGSNAGAARSSRRQTTAIDPVTAYLSTHGPNLGPIMTPSQVHAFSRGGTVRPGIAIPVSLNTAFDLQIHPALGVFITQDDREEINPREDTLSSFPRWQNATKAHDFDPTKPNATFPSSSLTAPVSNTSTATVSSSGSNLPPLPSPHPSVPGNPNDPREYLGIWGARRLLRDAGSGRGPSLPTLSTAHPTAAAVAKHAVSLCKIHVHSIPFLCDCDSSDEDEDLDTAQESSSNEVVGMTSGRRATSMQMAEDVDSSDDDEDNILFVSRGSRIYQNMPRMGQTVSNSEAADAESNRSRHSVQPLTASLLEEPSDDEKTLCYLCKQRFEQTDENGMPRTTNARHILDIPLCFFCNKSESAYVKYQCQRNKKALQKMLYLRLKELHKAANTIAEITEVSTPDEPITSAPTPSKDVPNYRKRFKLRREVLGALLHRLGDQTDVLSSYLMHYHIHQESESVADNNVSSPVGKITPPSESLSATAASKDIHSSGHQNTTPITFTRRKHRHSRTSSVSETSLTAVPPMTSNDTTSSLSSDPSNTLSESASHGCVHVNEVSDGDMDRGYISSEEESLVSISEIEELAEHYRSLCLTEFNGTTYLDASEAISQGGKEGSLLTSHSSKQETGSDSELQDPKSTNRDSTTNALVGTAGKMPTDVVQKDTSLVDVSNASESTGQHLRSYLPPYLQLLDSASDPTSPTSPPFSPSAPFTLFDYYKQQASLAHSVSSSFSNSNTATLPSDTSAPSDATPFPHSSSRSQTLHAFSRSLAKRLPRGCTLLVGGVYETAADEEALPVLLPLASGAPLAGSKQSTEELVSASDRAKGTAASSDLSKDKTTASSTHPSSAPPSPTPSVASVPSSNPLLHFTHHSGYTYLHPPGSDPENPGVSDADYGLSHSSSSASISSSSSAHTHTPDLTPAASALPGLSLLVVHYKGRAFLRPVVTGPERFVSRSLQAALGLGIDRSNTLLSPHRNLSGRKASNAITYANQALAIPSAPPALDFAEQPYHTALPLAPSTTSSSLSSAASAASGASSSSSSQPPVSWLAQMQQSFALALKRSTSNRLVHSLKRKAVTEPLPWTIRGKTYAERPFLPVLTDAADPITLYPNSSHVNTNSDASSSSNQVVDASNDGVSRKQKLDNNRAALPLTLYSALGLPIPSATAPAEDTKSDGHSAQKSDSHSSANETTDLTIDAKTDGTSATSDISTALPSLDSTERRQLAALQSTIGPVLLTSDARPAIASRAVSRSHLADLLALGVPPAEVLNPICLLTYLHCRRLYAKGTELQAIQLFQQVLLRIQAKENGCSASTVSAGEPSSDTPSQPSSSHALPSGGARDNADGASLASATASPSAEKLPLATDAAILRAVLASAPGSLAKAVLAGRTPLRWSAGWMVGREESHGASSASGAAAAAANASYLGQGAMYGAAEMAGEQDRFSELGKRMATERDRDRKSPLTKRTRV